eukprot:SAG11_NODE_1171_length_5613_cov_16.969895_1_plen_363_part_00
MVCLQIEELKDKLKKEETRAEGAMMQMLKMRTELNMVQQRSHMESGVTPAQVLELEQLKLEREGFVAQLRGMADTATKQRAEFISIGKQLEKEKAEHNRYQALCRDRSEELGALRQRLQASREAASHAKGELEGQAAERGADLKATRKRLGVAEAELAKARVQLNAIKSENGALQQVCRRRRRRAAGRLPARGSTAPVSVFPIKADGRRSARRRTAVRREPRRDGGTGEQARAGGAEPGAGAGAALAGGGQRAPPAVQAQRCAPPSRSRRLKKKYFKGSEALAIPRERETTRVERARSLRAPPLAEPARAAHGLAPTAAGALSKASSETSVAGLKAAELERCATHRSNALPFRSPVVPLDHR